MQRQVSRRALTLFGLLLTSASCVAPLQREQEELRQKLASVQAQLAEERKVRDEFEKELTRVRSLFEYETERLSSRIECHNDKVREFIKECEQDSSVCSEQGVANALTFMGSQQYVVMFLRPGEHFDAKAMPLTRRGQMMTLTDSAAWRPSTKFLVLVQPDSEERQKEALRIGSEIKHHLRDTVIVRRFPILGPKVLPCKLKQEQLARYFRRNDNPVKGEPSLDEPHIRLWIFKTDC